MRLPGVRFRRCAGAIACLLLLVPAADRAGAVPLPTRTAIDLLYVSTSDAFLSANLVEWASSLELRLQTSLAWDPQLNLSQARLISVRPLAQLQIPSAAQIESHWRQAGDIQIVFGQGHRDGQEVVVEANVYLGALRGALPGPALPISQTISGAAFRKSSDLVMLLTLYALAIDAKDQKATSCQLLHRAFAIGRGLPASVQSADAAKQAVKASLTQEGC